MPFDLSKPISPAELHNEISGGFTLAEAQCFCRGLSPGVGVLGACILARQACLARRYHHPALDREQARTFAKRLAGLTPEQVLRRLLQRENGLAEIGDLHERYRIGTALDALLEQASIERLEQLGKAAE